MTEKPNLADARRVTEAATEGEWINLPSLDDGVYIVGACDHVGCHDYPMDHPDVLRIKDDEVLYGLSQEDAEFIAASRTLIPALLAAVDAVLALHGPFTGENSAEDYMRAVRATVTAHLDIEPR